MKLHEVGELACTGWPCKESQALPRNRGRQQGCQQTACQEEGSS